MGHPVDVKENFKSSYEGNISCKASPVILIEFSAAIYSYHNLKLKTIPVKLPLDVEFSLTILFSIVRDGKGLMYLPKYLKN